MGLLTVQEAEFLRSVGRISTDDVAMQDGVIHALAGDTSAVNQVARPVAGTRDSNTSGGRAFCESLSFYSS